MKQAGRAWRAAGCLAVAMSSGPAVAGDAAAGFEPVYALLQTHCGECHVQGRADGPWSLDAPPSASFLSECLGAPPDERLRCTTFHQLVDAPAPGIPAWIRPADGAASEPYAQACDPAVSFHIGHSLAVPLTDGECRAFLGWIEAGAPR